MRFPLREQVKLPVVFERYVPGALHRDGRRYLPSLVFRLPNGTLLSVVDRHHYVDPAWIGQRGIGQFVYLQSEIALQHGGLHRRGIVPERSDPQHVSTAPEAYGQIIVVPSWEVPHSPLPYQRAYTEFLLNVGDGVVGVRTNITATSIADQIGKERLEGGDWLHVARSRVDILGFERAAIAQHEGAHP